MDAPVLHPAYGSGPFAQAEGKYGHGYYTKADFIEILKYANARHIKVIPELNFPRTCTGSYQSDGIAI
jgi:hexosaminidase